MTIILMLIAAIPSSIILAFVVTSVDSQVLLVLGSYVSLIVNIIISLLIILFILSSCILSSKISKGENENE